MPGCNEVTLVPSMNYKCFAKDNRCNIAKIHSLKYPKIVSAYIPVKKISNPPINSTMTQKGKPFMLHGYTSLATVVVSSTLSHTKQVHHMFDNDLKTFWHSGTSDSKPFVRISFHAPTVISQIILGKRLDCCSTRYMDVCFRLIDNQNNLIYEKCTKNKHGQPFANGYVITVNFSDNDQGNKVQVKIVEILFKAAKNGNYAQISDLKILGFYMPDALAKAMKTTTTTTTTTTTRTTTVTTKAATTTTRQTETPMSGLNNSQLYSSHF